MTTRETVIDVRDLSIRYGTVTAVESVNFIAGKGEQVTLLGPSGCGKTSTLRAVAGLEKPTSGAIRILGRPMFDSAAGINVPAEQRGLSMVFQSYAIWPHMTVFDNVAYGLRVRNESGARLDEKVMAALELVKMTPYAKRNASMLSGGQQQRVALARACAFSPSVLLFDEPLSNLDAKLRAEMRIELRDLQHRLGVTSLYVTHDLEEALAMSDRIVVMRAGNIEQNGTAADIYNHPRTAFVADFVGSANLITGTTRPAVGLRDHVVIDCGNGQTMLAATLGRPVLPTGTVSLRTVHTRLVTVRTEVDHPNVWPVTIKKAVFLGDLTQIHVDWGGRELILREVTAKSHTPGESAFLSIAPHQCILLEA